MVQAAQRSQSDCTKDNNLKFKITTLAIIFFIAIDVWAENIDPFVMPSTRAQSLGGNHVALVDDFSNAFDNPAGLAAIEPVFSVAEFSFDTISLETLTQLYINELRVGTFEKLVKERLDAGLIIGGPLHFGKIKDGFGWRVFNVTRMNVYWERNAIFYLNPRYSEEIVGNIGYGYRIMDNGEATLDAGILAKLFYRIVYMPNHIAIQEVAHILSQMKENPFESQMGGGIDLGLRWTTHDSFSLAVVYRDVISPAYTARYSNIDKYMSGVMYEESAKFVEPLLSFGFTWRRASPEMHRWNTDLILSGDYSGILDVRAHKKSQLLYLSAGLELRFLEVTSIRIGISEALPTGGLGINFTRFQLDLSIGGRELGTSPYERSTWFANIAFTFRY
jgi:hypothetical protein